MDSEIEELVDAYRSELAELTFNSKPIITNLTIIAGENSHAAEFIANAICDHILKVAVLAKLPALYLLDSIVKNEGGAYTAHFERQLDRVFVRAYEAVDPSTRTALLHLFGTWREVFAPAPLHAIEAHLRLVTRKPKEGAVPAQLPAQRAAMPGQQRVAASRHQMAVLGQRVLVAPPQQAVAVPAQRITGSAVPSGPVSGNRIHVNPKYLQAQAHMQRQDQGPRVGFSRGGEDSTSRPVLGAWRGPMPGGGHAREEEEDGLPVWGAELPQSQPQRMGAGVGAGGGVRVRQVVGRNWSDEDLEEWGGDGATAHPQVYTTEHPKQEFDHFLPPTYPPADPPLKRPEMEPSLPPPPPLYPPQPAVGGIAEQLDQLFKHPPLQPNPTTGPAPSPPPPSLFPPGVSASSSNTLTPAQLLNALLQSGLSLPAGQPATATPASPPGVPIPYPDPSPPPLLPNLNLPQQTVGAPPSPPSIPLGGTAMSLQGGGYQGEVAPEGGASETGGNQLFLPSLLSSLVSSGLILAGGGVVPPPVAPPTSTLPLTPPPMNPPLPPGPRPPAPPSLSTAPPLPPGPPPLQIGYSSAAQGLPPVPPFLHLETDFRTDFLKDRHESVIRALYESLANQCGTCGRRFREREAYSLHLDTHFEANKRMTKQRSDSRMWCATTKDWLAGTAVQHTHTSPFLEEEGGGGGAGGGGGEEGEEGDDEHIAPADESQETCILCGDRFQIYFSAEDDEWKYRGVVHMGGGEEGLLVHFKCLRTSTNQGQEQDQKDHDPILASLGDVSGRAAQVVVKVEPNVEEDDAQDKHKRPRLL